MLDWIIFLITFGPALLIIGLVGWFFYRKRIFKAKADLENGAVDKVEAVKDTTKGWWQKMKKPFQAETRQIG